MFEIIVNDETKEFVNSLETKLRAATYSQLEILKQKGNELRPPYSASLGIGKRII
ncbi:MAG: hypothetical protein LUC34_05405 [Campylobacter sp.]|nr:hypothetical protein [Campylobacter sp.]